MFLKSIEVQGFKSFANKTHFEFKKGITGIVGPNGSGKSNVADAVRWVLGEQSAKQLRGSKMEDIIFSGTENRKPLGFAYVALTIDNADGKLAIAYPEVTVARRVYRSGESEYLINGHKARLKEVQELFMDTGIGKEGYSIIGQGQIDRIISGKPEERRELFDEAVGIVKFKKRKATAEKQLLDEKQNLYRVNDIISEIEDQIEPLKEQAHTARIYLQHRDELKEYEINDFLREMDKTEGAIIEYDNHILTVSDQLENVSTALQQVKVDYEKIDQQEEQQQQNIDEFKNKKNDDIVKKEKLEGEINVLLEQINSGVSNRGHFTNRLESIQLEMQEKQDKNNEYMHTKAEMDVELDNLDTEKDDTEAALQTMMEKVTDQTEEIAGKQLAIRQIMDEMSTVRIRVGQNDAKIEQIHVRESETTGQMLKIKGATAEIAEAVTQLEQQMKHLVHEIVEAEKENAQNNNEMITVQEHIGKTYSMLDESQKKYFNTKSKWKALANHVERYEGYGNAIKRVMELGNKKKGIEGVVADIIRLNQEYEVAIETALSGSIQNIVTDSEQTAKELIQYLKEHRYGRATFLPLTSVNHQSVFRHEGVLQEEGVIGLAKSLVQTDNKYRSLIDHLLGRIVVVRDIGTALTIAKKYHYSLRIVTLGGELLSPGGSMTGGAFKNKSNLLSRNREMIELQKQTEECKEEVERLQNSIEELKDSKSDLTDKINQQEFSIQECKIQHSKLEESLKQSIRQLTEYRERYHKSQSEEAALGIQLQTLLAEAEADTQALRTLEEQLREEESVVAKLSSFSQKEQEQVEILRRKAEDLRVCFSELEQKDRFYFENIKSNKKDIKRLEEEAGVLKKDIDSILKEEAKRQTRITELKNQIEEMKEIFEAEDKQLAEALLQKEALVVNKKALFSQRETLSDELGALDKEVFRLASQKEKMETTIGLQQEYMQEEYGLSYQQALGFKNLELGESSTIKKNIGSLKNKIKNLGQVNVGAIEEYKVKSQRYQFLTTQRDDLLSAEENLMKIIEELNESMKHQFQTKFQEIEHHFDRVFKVLFGGGKATIELIDDTDMLESGIKIITQPPGKKLQNMMQLSGGEKAFSAIALLFAIQGLKPSPFCLLDEIEAALDESNVSRFAHYLHKLTNDTQFIIITHRKGTMEAADALYGVTMQEKGISTLVSVSLIRDKDLK